MSSSSSSEYSKRGTSEGVATTTPTGIQPYQTQFGQGYADIYKQYKNITGQPLNLQQAPLYSKTLDPVVQNAISKGIQGIKAQQGTQAMQSANTLGTAGTGSNAALLNVLNRQAAIQGGAMGNQLYSTGLEAQKGYDFQRQQMIQMQNADILAKRNAQVAGLQPGVGLLQALIQMGQLSKGSVTSEKKKFEESGEGTASKPFFG